MDILVNQHGDVELDDREDLAVVEGRREKAEQSIRLMLTAYFYQRLGSVTAVNAVEKMELQARRVAENNQYVDSVAQVTAEIVTDNDGTDGAIEINITFNSETSAFTIGD
jgi:hypothetical protein